MLRDGILATAIKAGIVAVIGAVVSILVERAWKRHKIKLQAKVEERP